MASDPLLADTIAFLSDPTVASSTIEAQNTFLRGKGVSDATIAAARTAIGNTAPQTESKTTPPPPPPPSPSSSSSPLVVSQQRSDTQSRGIGSSLLSLATPVVLAALASAAVWKAMAWLDPPVDPTSNSYTSPGSSPRPAHSHRRSTGRGSAAQPRGRTPTAPPAAASPSVTDDRIDRLAQAVERTAASVDALVASSSPLHRPAGPTTPSPFSSPSLSLDDLRSRLDSLQAQVNALTPDASSRPSPYASTPQHVVPPPMTLSPALPAWQLESPSVASTGDATSAEDVAAAVEQAATDTSPAAEDADSDRDADVAAID